jgi:pimeloyl-ACP methyl ester carboxylesterase
VNAPETLQLAVRGFAFDALATGPPDGPLVLLLHGWPQFADSWTDVAAGLGAAGYRAVAIDQRGYSPGARPLEVEAYAVGELVADVAAFATALGAERFHLVGHDWGGIVGWAAAASIGSRLASFASLATPHPTALGRAIATDPDQQAKSAYVDFFRLPGGVAEKALLAGDGARLRAVYGGVVAPAQVESNLRRLSEPGALTAVLNWYRAFGFGGSIGPTSVPALYLWGSNDLALGERAARATADFATGPYRFDVLDGVSHWIVDEVPQRALTAVREHLAAYPITK